MHWYIEYNKYSRKICLADGLWATLVAPCTVLQHGDNTFCHFQPRIRSGAAWYSVPPDAPLYADLVHVQDIRQRIAPSRDVHEVLLTSQHPSNAARCTTQCSVTKPALPECNALSLLAMRSFCMPDLCGPLVANPGGEPWWQTPGECVFKLVY